MLQFQYQKKLEKASMMNRNYSFANRRTEHTDNQTSSSYTEERIAQIMKKYEKPYRKNENHERVVTPVKFNGNHSCIPMKTEPEERNYTPLKQTNLNVEKYGYSYDRMDKQSWKNDRHQKDSFIEAHERTGKYEKYTPKRYGENLYGAEESGVKNRRTFDFSDENSYVSPYKENKRSSFKPVKTEAEDVHITMNATSVWTKIDEDYTPTKKYSHKMTESYDKAKRQEIWKKQKQISMSVQKSFDVVDCDSRISNIDKINLKIKSLLDTGSGVHSGYKFRDIEKEEINVGNQRNNQKYRGIGDRLDLRLNLGFVEKENEKKEEVRNQQKSVKDYKNMERSKSCLYLENNKKNYLAKTPKGKDIDDQYNKIQQKIAQFNHKIATHDEEKKKLNLELTPTKSSSSFLDRNMTKNSATKSTTKIPTQINQSMKSTKKLPEVDILESHRESETNVNDHQIIFPEKMEEVTQVKGRQIIIDNPCPSKCVFESKDFVESQFYSNMDDFSMDPQTFFCDSNSETKKLTQYLSEQVKLDEQFRLTKNWFINSQINQEYEVLQSILGQRWREMSYEEVEAEFSVNFEEDDPFYSYRPDHYVLEDLVNNYIICNRNWKENIERQWNMEQLKQEGLMQKLDMDSKDYITIEDLVRIINMQEGTFFRNRDLYLIFQRMSRKEIINGDKISLQTLTKLLDSN